jgi:hypothetical protein
VTFDANGNCVIDFNQAGNANYSPAPQVRQTVTVPGLNLIPQTIAFTSAPPTNAVFGGTYTPTATASSGLPVTITIDSFSSSDCSISGGVVTFTGTFECVIDANQAGNTTYAPARQVEQTVSLGKGPQTIIFTSTAPTNAVVGGPTYTPTAIASSGLPVTLTIDSTTSANCSIDSSGVVTFTAAGSCTIDANQAGNSSYNSAPQAQQTFAVGPGSQTITFTSTAPTIAPKGGTYTPTATASSGLPVNITIDSSSSSVCSISGGVVTFNVISNCVIDANQPGNADYLPALQVQQVVPVETVPNEITATSTAPTNATVAGPTYTPTATDDYGLPVMITIDSSSSSVCSITGGVVTFDTTGNCVVDFNQPGNANVNAATQVQQSFTVGKGSQTISPPVFFPCNPVVGGTCTVSPPPSSSGLPVTITIDSTTSGNCSVSGDVVSFTAVGYCTVDFNQAGNSNYNPAPQVQQTFPVGKGSQTIAFTSTAPTNAVVGGVTYTPTARASSGLTVAITIDSTTSSDCSISGEVVSFTAAGNCVIDANQPGNANWNPAPQVQQTFPVGKGSQTISIQVVCVGRSCTVTATATSGLPVTVTIDPTASANCSISGDVVTINAAGSCVIDANQPGNANWNPAPQVQAVATFTPTPQTITFTSTAPTNAVIGSTYTPTATASSGLPVTLTVDSSSSAVCSLSGGVVTFDTPGNCVIDANQAGSSTYAPAAQVQQKVTVVKANQTITVTSTAPTSAVVGGTYTPTATASSGLAVAITIDSSSTSICSISGGVVTFNAAGSCVIDFNQAGNANWNAAAQVQQTVTVSTVTAKAPVALADHYYTGINTKLTVAAPGVLGNDTLNGATLVSHTNPAHGTLVLNADGSFTYTPSFFFIGIDSFTYTLKNSIGSASAAVTIDVPARADLALSLTAPGSVKSGSSFTYSVKVTNNGPDPALSMTTGIYVPAGLTVTSVTPAGTEGFGFVLWTDSSLASGASVTYSVTVKVTVKAGSSLIGTAAAASSSLDPNLFNNFGVTITKVTS